MYHMVKIVGKYFWHWTLNSKSRKYEQIWIWDSKSPAWECKVDPKCASLIPNMWDWIIWQSWVSTWFNQIIIGFLWTHIKMWQWVGTDEKGGQSFALPLAASSCGLWQSEFSLSLSLQVECTIPPRQPKAWNSNSGPYFNNNQSCQLTHLKRVRPAFQYKTCVTRLLTQTLLRGDFVRVDTFCSGEAFSTGQNSEKSSIP